MGQAGVDPSGFVVAQLLKPVTSGLGPPPLDISISAIAILEMWSSELVLQSGFEPETNTAYKAAALTAELLEHEARFQGPI